MVNRCGDKINNISSIFLVFKIIGMFNLDYCVELSIKERILSLYLKQSFFGAMFILTLRKNNYFACISITFKLNILPWTSVILEGKHQILPRQRNIANKIQSKFIMYIFPVFFNRVMHSDRDSELLKRNHQESIYSMFLWDFLVNVTCTSIS